MACSNRADGNKEAIEYRVPRHLICLLEYRLSPAAIPHACPGGAQALIATPYKEVQSFITYEEVQRRRSGGCRISALITQTKG